MTCSWNKQTKGHKIIMYGTLTKSFQNHLDERFDLLYLSNVPSNPDAEFRFISKSLIRIFKNESLLFDFYSNHFFVPLYGNKSLMFFFYLG